jgi:hypothetical protein
MGYHQQPAHPEGIKKIVTALQELADETGDIDFILHGGDMIDFFSEQNVAAAADLFSLDVPVRLCLGNHDLTSYSAAEQWISLAPRFFPTGEPNYTIKLEHCVIHVAPNHWCGTPFYWANRQSPYLSESQHEWLGNELNEITELPHILVTHSPTLGLPKDQVGKDGSVHAPPESFTAEVMTLAKTHPSLRCVLGAHNHMNMNLLVEHVDFLTVSALVETPFECKLFEVTKDLIHMSTISLKDRLPFADDYDRTRKFVQGRLCDRELTMKLDSDE